MQTNTTPTLLQAIRQDPDTGLRWAMRDYAALVRGIARRILPGHDRDIEECTADVFVALWRNAARLEATGTPVRAWLIVTARNTAINRYRALQRHDTLPLTDELAATIADLPADPAKAAALAAGDGAPLPWDVGRLNGRPFVYVAAFGAFTQVAYATPQDLKNALGHLAYVLGGIKELPSIRSRPATDSHSASMVASASTGRFRSCGVVTLLP